MERIKYRREDEMKDSGIEWLGKIPKEWGVSKLGKVSLIKTGNTPSMQGEEDYYENGEVLWVKPDDLNSFTPIDDTKEKINKLGIPKARIVPPYTPLICCIGSIGKFGYSQHSVAYNQQINSIRFDENKINWEYGLYFLSIQEAQHWYYSTGNVVNILNSQNQKQITIPKLTLKEQQKIANFLDIKTSQFDSIISKKEKLIEKLEEAKKSLISEVVTGKVKIVDGEIVERKPEEMKDSGVEWLGMIPKDWEVTLVKYYYDVKLGKMLQPRKNNINDTLQEYLCTINVDWKGLKLETVKKMWFSKSDLNKYEVKKGDLIVNEGGDAGKACIVKELKSPLYMQNAVHRVRPKSYLPNSFLYYWLFYLKSINYIELICNKATIMHFTADKFNNLNIILPEVEDIDVNIAFLDNKIAKIDTIIENQKAIIQKLKEAKQSLISEAVTGKIDLRDWEIREVDES